MLSMVIHAGYEGADIAENFMINKKYICVLMNSLIQCDKKTL